MKKFGTQDSHAPRPGASAGPGQLSSLRAPLRLAATLAFAGFAVSVIAGLFHADTASANDHPATFAEYARSGIWTAVHLGAVRRHGASHLRAAGPAGGPESAGRGHGLGGAVRRCGGGRRAGPVCLAPGRRRRCPQARRGRLGCRRGTGEDRPVCDRRGHPVARVGHAQLPELRAGRGPAPDRCRGCRGAPRLRG